MKRSHRLLLASVTSLFLTAWASAATYYVDFAGGDNKAAGTSAQAAWKHAPGDANATDSPAAAKLAPGDTVIFKGGVSYHGSISLTVSGEAGKPITLDGNTAGNFGKGRAVLDGGRVIEGWKRVASADQAKGNPKWKDLFYADVDVDISKNAGHGEFVVHRQAPRDKQAPWQRIILIDGDRRLLPIAQFPKPKDPFYPDLPGDFLETKAKLDVQDDASLITDEANLTAKEANAYDGMFVGVHGGNNHVYFGRVKGYDPAKHQLSVPTFTPKTYETTKYALYNSVKLIETPGEWAIEALEYGKSRVYLLPERLEKGQPVNIGYPDFQTGISIDNGASHAQVKGFLIQRYSGGAGGVSVARSSKRTSNVHIADCEIRFVSGHAGVGLNYCDEIVVEKCYVHHCPAWTTGVFLSRVNNYVVRDCYLDKNSGSGIRHYECKEGVVQNNVIMDHFGMHSSAINVYEGCANLVIEGNYIQNTVTINRNADNIVFRNNVIDGLGRSAVTMAIWGSGTTGGRAIRNVQFLNNTFVNTNHGSNYGAAIFGQKAKGASSPEGLVIRNNILDRVNGDVPGTFQNNLYTRDVDKAFQGEGSQVVKDLDALFRDPKKGDFRRKPGGPAMDVGANVPPPPEKPAGF